MEIVSQSQVILRDAGYATHELGPAAMTFEDDTLLGFVHVFPDVGTLLAEWISVQRAVLARSAPQLRMSREKAWNVYALFLTGARPKADEQRALDAIEEDFAATRKIARAPIGTLADLRQALLPLLPIIPGREATVSDYQTKLRGRLSMLPPAAVDAIIGTTEPDDIARILMERP
jgi:hypothetical protein